MRIRDASTEDAGALARVFYRSVHEGPSPYTQAQRSAWLPAPPDPEKFRRRLVQQFVLVAEQRGATAGFMTLDDSGYIDLAFILPQARGTGMFRALYSGIEGRARAMAIEALRTHASLTAQPAFQAMGFAVIEHETVALGTHGLRRALMEKQLT